MRVLIVASYNKGHFAPFIVEQVDSLCRIGVECEFFGVEGKGIVGYLHNFSLLLSKIKAYHPDMIHAHYGLCGLLSNLQRRIPVVTTYHGSDINNPKVRVLSRVSMCLSRHNIFVSQRQIDIVKPHRKFSLIPCGINLEDYPIVPKAEARDKMGLEANKKYILFAGAFDNKVKNYPLAKAAVELLDDDVELLELKGYTRKQVALLMNAVDCFLMTSFTEGSPQVIKEAMACGCPIVSVDVGDVRDVIGVLSGSFVCNRNPKDISESLKFAIHFDGRTKGQERIMELGLTNAEVASKLVDIYRIMI